jgi:hypothetical protein
LPFNFEAAAGVEIGESVDLSFFGFDVAVTSDAGQMAAGKHNETRTKQYERELFHPMFDFSIKMRQGVVLDSRNFKERWSLVRRWGDLEIAPP